MNLLFFFIRFLAKLPSSHCRNRQPKPVFFYPSIEGRRCNQV